MYDNKMNTSGEISLYSLPRIFYLYLAQNKLPCFKGAIRQVKAQTKEYLLLDSLIFRI